MTPKRGAVTHERARPLFSFMALQKVHLLRYAQSSSLRRTFYVRLIPQLSQALHLELFALPS